MSNPFRNALLAALEPDVPETERADVAWSKLPGALGDPFRWTPEGKLIHRHAYGDRSSPFGWEVDHVMPIVLGGRHTRGNLCARHWQDNARAGGHLANALAGPKSNAMAEHRNTLADDILARYASPPVRRNALLDVLEQYEAPRPDNALTRWLERK